MLTVKETGRPLLGREGAVLRGSGSVVELLGEAICAKGSQCTCPCLPGPDLGQGPRLLPKTRAVGAGGVGGRQEGPVALAPSPRPAPLGLVPLLCSGLAWGWDTTFRLGERKPHN